MAVSVQDPYDTTAAQKAASSANYGKVAAPASTPAAPTAAQIDPYIQTTVADLNSGNYLGAWNEAESSDKLYGTPTNDAATTDPLLQAMQTNTGLQELDPSKQWNASSDAAYYQALGQSQGYTGSNDLGKNPYGLWGSQAATQNGTDANANVAQAGATPDVARFAGATPTTSFLSKYGADIAAVAATVVTMGAAAPAMAAVLGSTLAAGAAAGAIGGAVGVGVNAAEGHATTLGSVAESVGGGALAGMVPGLGADIGSATGLGTMAGTALAGAGVGAIRAGAAGGNVGLGAALGGVGGAIAGSGASSAISGAVGGGMLGNAVGGLATGIGTNLINQGITGAFGNGSSGGNGGSSMMSSTGGSGSLLTGLMGAGAGLLGMNANQNQNNTQMNAYTTAGNAANSGNVWGATGIGGLGSTFNNGQLNTSAGGFNPMVAGYQSLGNSQLGMANAYGSGGVPSNVTQSYNNLNSSLGSAQMYAGQGQQTGLGMMNSGANMFNSANTNYNSAYNTSLNSGLAALNPAIQQQSNALLNSNFERGMAGTSGGALQTQALQNSFNTADLQVQQNAVSQGLAAMNTTGNLGLSAYSAGSGQMGNFNSQQSALGSTGLNAGMSYSAFSPQLAGMYQTNANNAVQGASGINTMALQNAQAGLAGSTNMGNQLNAGARTQGSISTASTYNPGGSAYLGSLLGGASGMGSGASALGSGLGSALSSLFGGSNTGATGSFSAMPQDFTSGNSMPIGSNGIPTSLSSDYTAPTAYSSYMPDYMSGTF